MTGLEVQLPILAAAGSIGIAGAALALGIRHGIDWDHIAAITDITSTAANPQPAEEKWLTGGPALMLTDESHHAIAHSHEEPQLAVAAPASAPVAAGHPGTHIHADAQGGNGSTPGRATAAAGFVRAQRPALLLGTLYALGHASVVVVLGLLAILARGFLPDWIDPIMARVVGVTLIVLAAYLFYAIFRYFGSGDEFRMRSRWMLVFAGMRNGYDAVRSRIFGKPRTHVHAAQQYGVRTAFGIGAIHGVGAETGTQVLVITTAAGASTQIGGVVALFAFVLGLLISNSAITVISTAGFVSTRQRQLIYVGAGAIAAVFSLVVGLLFLFGSSGVLPSLTSMAGLAGALFS
jgi:high-affinity nickel-transport protein